MKFKKELLALVCGILFAYLWQLFYLMIIYLSDKEFVQPSMFIPVITIQLGIAPMAWWILMGLFKVNWFTKWLKITATALAFLIPFVVIAMRVFFINPTYWHNIKFWIVNAILSLLVMNTLFRPLVDVDMSNFK